MLKKYISIIFIFFVLALILILYFFSNEKKEAKTPEPSQSLFQEESDPKIWIDSSTPKVIQDAVNDFIKSNKNSKIAKSKNEASIFIEKTDKNEGVIYREYLVPTTSFNNMIDNITLADIASFYPGKYSKDFITLIPFDELSPKMKVLKVEGKNIFDKAYDDSKTEYFPVEKYAINSKNKNDKKKISEYLNKEISPSNREVKKIASVASTGVTAISRAVEYMINAKNDPIYPARGVMDTLSRYDLVIVDSENPFFDTCPISNAESMILCGRTRSIASLKALGKPIIDLTGNHQNDFGNDKARESMQHLKDNGFESFGGGQSENEAAKIAYKEMGGTKVAFLGYNYFDSLGGKASRALAYQNRPGANFYDEGKMQKDIIEARKNADIVVVDFQFNETYSYNPLKEQVNVFRKAIDMGADIVVGVQAHQPQKMEFYGKGVIFYGLGNFFFDQMWSYPTRQGLIPVYNFYDGKLVSIEILTTLLYDYSQPRLTLGSEREELLNAILPK